MSEVERSQTVGKDFARVNIRQRFISAASKTRKNRVNFIMGCFLAFAVLIVYRLYSYQIKDLASGAKKHTNQHFSKIVLAPERAPIFDREGRIFAVSVPAGSIYIRPQDVRDKKKVTEILVEKLELEPEFIAQKLASKQPFVWIKRQIPRAVAEEIAALKIDGLSYMTEARRYYPFNHAAGHLIGRVGVDGNGLAGIEAKYEKELQAGKLEILVAKDAHGKTIQIDATSTGEEAKKTEPLKLTLDGVIQTIVDQELLVAQKDAKAKSTRALMIDALSGEILAWGQVPFINQNVGGQFDPNLLHNEIVESVFEPGSIFKPIVAAAAIDQGFAVPDQMIDCQNGSFQFGRKRIKDVHPSGIISLHDVIVRSSNIGIAKVGLTMGTERLYRALRDFGFGVKVGLGLPGENAGILRRPERWAAIDVATHSFGQGIAVNSLQMVRGFSALVNGGILPKLHLVKGQSDPTKYEEERVITKETSLIARAMLRDVVENPRGTGKKAAVPGFEVGGKTGTAQKTEPGVRGYKAGAYVSSFVGYIDLTPIGEDRRLTLLVSVDEASTGVIYGGALAGPPFSKIMSRTANYLATQAVLRQKSAINEAKLLPTGASKQ